MEYMVFGEEVAYTAALPPGHTETPHWKITAGTVVVCVRCYADGMAWHWKKAERRAMKDSIEFATVSSSSKGIKPENGKTMFRLTGFWLIYERYSIQKYIPSCVAAQPKLVEKVTALIYMLN